MWHRCPSPRPTSLPHRILAQQKEFQALKKGLGGARVQTYSPGFGLGSRMCSRSLRAALYLACAVR